MYCVFVLYCVFALYRVFALYCVFRDSTGRCHSGFQVLVVFWILALFTSKNTSFLKVGAFSH